MRASMSDPRLELGDTYNPDWIPLAGERGGFFHVGRLPFCLFRFSDAPDDSMKVLLRRLGAKPRSVKPLGSWVVLFDSLDEEPDGDQVDESIQGDGSEPAVDAQTDQDERDSLLPGKITIADPEWLAVRVTTLTFNLAADEVPFKQAHLDRRRINQIICDHYDSTRAIALENNWTCTDAALECPAIQRNFADLLERLQQLATISPSGLPTTFWQRLRSAWSDVDHS